MRTFDISHELDTRTCVARLDGDIDTAVVPELRRDLDSALEAGCTNLVLDLTDVTYADSSALGLLVWLDHRVRPLHGKIVLAGANRDVMRILELSGLINVAASIGMSANVEAAIEGFSLGVLPSETLWERHLEIDCDVNMLAGAREEVSSMIAPLGFPESALFDIKVAVGEALANAVRHGEPTTGEGVVSVDVLAFEDRVVIEVADRGVGFDGVHNTSSADLYAPSGRGIMFMRALMDRVEFLPAPGGGTLVRLVKHRRSEAA
jgi:anti-anti-sigma factor